MRRNHTDNAVIPQDECVIWPGSSDGRYGTRTIDGRPWKAHRWAYVAAYGPIPDGLEIDHLCEQTLCVNPAHLEAVTHSANLRRHGDRRGTVTCPDCGHRHRCHGGSH